MCSRKRVRVAGIHFGQRIPKLGFRKMPEPGRVMLAEMMSFPRSLCPRKRVAGIHFGQRIPKLEFRGMPEPGRVMQALHVPDFRSGRAIRLPTGRPRGLNGPGKGANIRGVRVRPDFIPAGKPDTA